jgi:uncharacterized membrane protein
MVPVVTPVMRASSPMRFAVRVRSHLENIRASLWFIPSMLVALAFIMALTLTEIDRAAASSELAREREWLFSGTPSAARTMLSVIAGSLITVISLLFSITMLTLQQAATQFTPRVIRSFTQDRGNQIVLGVYVATFVYAILVLRQIRDSSAIGDQFVPVIAVTMAVILALVCLGLLVYFIHHSATVFQAATVIERVHQELLEAIDRLYPESIGVPDEDVDLDTFRDRRQYGPTTTVLASSAGYLRAVDDRGLIDALPRSGWVIVYPQVGAYVLRGEPLVELGGGQDSAVDDEQVRRAFVLDRQRTMTQDALFGIRQLVDIALKALSPSINDPTTAEHAIGCLANALAQLAQRALPSRERAVEYDNGRACLVLWTNRPSFAEMVDEAVSQIRRAAGGQPHVQRNLLMRLTAVMQQTSGERSTVLRQHLSAIADDLTATGTGC